MEITSYFNIVLLTGSALSLVMAIFLWINSHQNFANKVLGVMNLLWAFVVAVFAMQSKEFYMHFPHLSRVVSIIPLMLFPLLYIYIKSYLYDHKWRFWPFIIHFLPVLIYFLAISPYFFQPAEAKRQIIASGHYPTYLQTIGTLFDIVIILQGIFYTTISMQLIQQFARSISGRLTRLQRYILNWLKFFVISYVFLWAFGSVGAVMEMLRISIPLDMFNIFYLGLTILTVSIGIFAIRRPDVLLRPVHTGLPESRPGAKTERSHRPSGSREEVQRILDFLEKEKAYLKNDLSMDDMAKATGLPKHRISALLNEELGKNFYEILNEYRTNEAIRLMNEGKHLSFTLTYIAEMAGFNSKATFNRIFKKITNQTPSEYIHSLYGKEQGKE